MVTTQQLTALRSVADQTNEAGFWGSIKDLLGAVVREGADVAIDRLDRKRGRNSQDAARIIRAGTGATTAGVPTPTKTSGLMWLAVGGGLMWMLMRKPPRRRR